MKREDIIRQIVAREIANKPIDAGKVEIRAPALFAAANELFGTWETALRYAGVRHYERRAIADLTPDAVLRKLRHLCNNGYALGSRHNQKRDPQLFEATRKHFGTWRKSLTAAGIDINRLYRGTRGRQPAEVVEAIKRRHDQGLRMNRCYVMLEDNDLCMIGVRLFGSWGRALEAAGITPPETKPKWNQESIVRAIQIRYAKGGSLKHKAVRKSERSLYNAARSHFGSWHAARTAAGFDRQNSDD